MPKSKLRQSKPRRNRRRHKSLPFKPASMPIFPEACAYIGIGRAKFYTDVLPHIDCVRIGTRRLAVTESLDRFIAERATASPPAAS